VSSGFLMIRSILARSIEEIQLLVLHSIGFVSIDFVELIDCGSL